MPNPTTMLDNVKQLMDRQIRDPEELAGRVLRAVHETDETDSDSFVVLEFQDGRFAIINGNPEDDGCGLCLDAWWNRSLELVEELTRLLQPADARDLCERGEHERVECQYCGALTGLRKLGDGSLACRACDSQTA